MQKLYDKEIVAFSIMGFKINNFGLEIKEKSVYSSGYVYKEV